MRRQQNRARRHNMNFMWGMMAMAFVVLMIAILFLNWSFAPKA